MMAACDGLQHNIFEKPLPLQSMKTVDHYSFTEIFGQLYLKEDHHHLLDNKTHESSAASSYPLSPLSLSSSSASSVDSSSTCTEEPDEVDQDLLKNDEYDNKDVQHQIYRSDSRRYSRRNVEAFPPPISCIGRNGKPWVCFKSVREDGRFILTEIRIPTQEFLHACRKNGRLKMQFVQSDDEYVDTDEEDDGEIEDDGQVPGA